jgi:hypothetical protein
MAVNTSQSVKLGRGSFRLLHVLVRALVGDPPRARRILVLGAGRSAWEVECIRRAGRGRRFLVVGYVPTTGDLAGGVPMRERVPLRSNFVAFCRAHDIDEIVVAMDDHQRGFPLTQVNEGLSVIGLGAFRQRQERGVLTKWPAAPCRE